MKKKKKSLHLLVDEFPSRPKTAGGLCWRRDWAMLLSWLEAAPGWGKPAGCQLRREAAPWASAEIRDLSAKPARWFVAPERKALPLSPVGAGAQGAGQRPRWQPGCHVREGSSPGGRALLLEVSSFQRDG